MQLKIFRYLAETITYLSKIVLSFVGRISHYLKIGKRRHFLPGKIFFMETP